MSEEQSGHFYVKDGTSVFEWVETPKFFKCKGFELLQPNQEMS